VVSFTSRPLYPRRKIPRYLLDRRLGGPQVRSGQRGNEKILDPTATRTPNPRLSNPVASRYTDYAVAAPIVIYNVELGITEECCTYPQFSSLGKVKSIVVSLICLKKKYAVINYSGTCCSAPNGMLTIRFACW
jgi:hypothetical protein